MQEIKEFLSFFKKYLIARLIFFGINFEKIKDLIVALLIVKRGKYSSSFLNSSFLILVAATFIGGPIIAENNPFVSSYQNIDRYQAAMISYNPYGGALGTIISAKPRDKIENYVVKSGDTLLSIAKRFDVSVETIKWANNLKTETIKPGDILKIPPVTGVVHKVSSGETVYSIAKKYKVDPQNIVNFPFNDFADLDTFALNVGQILYVPGGVIEEEKPVTAPRFFAQIQAGVKGTSNFIWPASGLITQYPVWYHMAVDIANPAAPAILAADSGTVSYAGCVRYGYGCHVVIDHGNGYQTLYAHLSSIAVSVGQSILQGQTIGVMGSTGRSTGTHLHFEIRQGGQLLNPLNFLR